MNASITQYAPRILIVNDNPGIHSDFRKILVRGNPDEAAFSEAEATLFGSTYEDRPRF